MSDFSTTSTLQVTVDQNSLRSARKEIQSSIGSVPVRTDGGSGGASSSIAREVTSGGQGEVRQLLTDANEFARESLDVHRNILEELKKSGATSGGGEGGGGGVLGMIPGGMALRGALGAISTSALVGTAATVGAGALIAGGAVITADALINQGADVNPKDLIVGGAAISAGALIASSASISASSLIGSTVSLSAGSLISSAAVIPPAALIAGAAVISAGVLVSDSAVISAGALIGSAAAITAGVLIGSPAAVAAGALVGSAAIVSASDIIAEKVVASDLFNTSKSASEVSKGYDPGTGNNPPANPLLPGNPSVIDPAGPWHGMERPDIDYSDPTNASDVNVPEVNSEDYNVTVQLPESKVNVPTEPPDQTNSTSTNNAAENRGTTEVNASAEVTVEGASERDVERIVENKTQEMRDKLTREFTGGR